MRTMLSLTLLLALTGCSGNKLSVGINTGKDGAKAKALGEATAGTGDARCNGNVAGRETSEYDTSGDGVNDVRKVFARMGDATTSRLVLICRESDVNFDGRKDVIRYYDDEGRSLREESDRNFDGKMDLISVYQNGAIVRQESDDNNDGKIDTKVFYENGKAQRAERDLTGRSTEAQWHPDRWEYFEAGRMVRMGTDLDGDQRVDRWDRDMAWKRAEDAASAPDTTGTPAADGG